MTSSERHSRDDGGRERPSASLPAIRHSAFAKHWLAIDDGGAELTKAVFGAPARRAPPRPALDAPPKSCPATPTPHGGPAPTRLRATLALLLLALAVLFAQPAVKLLGLAARPESPGTAGVAPSGKPSTQKPNAPPETKRAGEA